MTTQTLKIKNGSINLPSNLKRAWQGKEALVRVSEDTILIKRMRSGNFWSSWEQLRGLKKIISRGDIEKAVKWARR